MSLRERIRWLLPLSLKARVRDALARVRRDSRASARRKVAVYRASLGGRPTCLHLGCGDHALDGWLNVDLLPAGTGSIAWDLRTGLGFLDDASIDFVFHEHFFEHLDRRSADRLADECRRVLKPGGWMRVSMPDLDRIVRRYFDGYADQDGAFRDYRGALFRGIERRSEELSPLIVEARR